MLEDHCADVKVLPEVQTLRSHSARDSATQSAHQFNIMVTSIIITISSFVYLNSKTKIFASYNLSLYYAIWVHHQISFSSIPCIGFVPLVPSSTLVGKEWVSSERMQLIPDFSLTLHHHHLTNHHPTTNNLPTVYPSTKAYQIAML